MDNTIIRTFNSNEWEKYRDLRLSSLDESPDAFGSTLEREQEFTNSDWRDRLTLSDEHGVNLPILAESDGVSVGLAWGRIHLSDKEFVHLYQMWVAPAKRGTGVGRLLLTQVISWAKYQNAKAVLLAVASGNSPATRLYSSIGFCPVGVVEPLRGGSEATVQPMRMDIIA